MQHILLPTDFSELALNAYRFAINIAARYQSTITLMHIHNYPIVDPYVPGSMLESINKNQKEEALKHFKEYEALHPDIVVGKRVDNVKMSHILEVGFVVPEIVRYCEEHMPDLVIMGTAGASGLSEIVLGSNTASVIGQVTVPVLAVPEDAQYNGIKNIVYATDFDKSDFHSLDKLLKFAALFKATIRCIHVNVDDSISDEVHYDDWKEFYWSEVEKGIIKFDLITGDDVLDGINQYIKENEIDLIAMLTHKKHLTEKLFGRSLTKKMAFHCNIPLLAFRAG